MADGSGALVVVNFEQVSEMLRGGLEAVSPGVSLKKDDAELVGAAVLKLQNEAGDKDVLKAPNDQAAALLQTFLGERALESGKVVEGHMGGLEARFDTHDVGWVREFIPWVRSKLGISKRAPRPPMTDGVDRLPNDCRIAILGDWGTGAYGAKPAAKAISDDGNYHAIVHLGDVYYSGGESEIQRQFLALWPSVPGAISRACNSNHEMYSGGGPYFRLTLPSFGQQSPVFALENDYWVLAGLDTAYSEHDLDQEQRDWLDRVIGRLEGRRLLLFSHHQLFSHLSGQGPKLQRWLEEPLRDGTIFAWYWGHEHRLVIYDWDPRRRIHARCVGHSGFPYFRGKFDNAPTEGLPDGQVFRLLAEQPNAPAARLLDGENVYLGDRADRYGPNGFMCVELQGGHLHEVALAPDGTKLWEGELA
jgi:predicted phosphodiesterase